VARYIVRVELHDTGDRSKAYDALHHEMGKHAFKQTITESRITYNLPSAEYAYHHAGEIRIEEVLRKAKAAADSTGKKYAILVSEIKDCMFDGLEKTSKALRDLRP